MPSETKTCSDCGGPWEYTAEEQKFIKEHGYVEPKRCKPCRIKKKNRMDSKGFDRQQESNGTRFDRNEETGY